ncbi:MAG: TMEM175 family protein [Candidatus Dormiibacterota bacterium]
MVTADYERVAGLSHERIAALSDGIFAVAMTLLVLGVALPAASEVKAGDEGALLKALIALSPRLVAYVLSFMTLGIFWVGQQAQLTHLQRSNRRFTWIHLGFLFGITLVPLSTGLLAQFIGFRVAVVIYWFNLLICGMALLASVEYIRHAKLAREEGESQILAANRRRILAFQALYAVSAALCVISPYLSIALIFSAQVLAVISPRIRGLPRV